MSYVFDLAREERRAFNAGARTRLLATIEANPGISTADLSRATMVPPSSAYSILRAAEIATAVHSVKRSACRHWFIGGAR